MRLVPQAIKKAVVTTVLSTCLISSFVTPAFAAFDANNLNNKIGNELEAAFNVTGGEVVNDVVLSWNENDPTDISLRSFDLTKDVPQTINYYVSPKAGNDNDLTVSVLLKIPTTSAAAVEKLEIDDIAVTDPAFSTGGFNYYVLDEDLVIGANDAAYLDTFDIAFNQTTVTGTPFAASLIAVTDTRDTSVKDLTFITSYHGNTDRTLLQYSPKETITNGVITIDLSDAIVSLTKTASEYGYFFYKGGALAFSDANGNYDPGTKVLTLQIPSAIVGETYDIIIFAQYEEKADYHITYKIDQDGVGTDYSETEETISFILDRTFN